MGSAEEILPDLWRFTALHPEWEEGEDWDAEVAWWAVRAPSGLVLIDPLVEDWDELDDLVGQAGGCAGVIRTVFFHERSLAEARGRYHTQVWARKAPPGVPAQPFDHATGGEGSYRAACAPSTSRVTTRSACGSRSSMRWPSAM